MLIFSLKAALRKGRDEGTGLLKLLNWKEINLILEELNLTGSLIQQVYQPKHSIILFSFRLFKSLLI